jgi:hypothetical protein
MQISGRSLSVPGKENRLSGIYALSNKRHSATAQQNDAYSKHEIALPEIHRPLLVAGGTETTVDETAQGNNLRNERVL